MLVPMDLPSRIFLSPHPDDIAYSCYASLVNPPAPRLDAIHIVTVFSVSVRANGELGQRKSQEEITRVRQREDEKFATSEGCRLTSLGFADSSVRGETNRGLELAIDDATKHPMFKSVKAALAKTIGPAIGYTSIYVPLGIGGHVDHRMVRDAARMLAIESNVPGALAGLRYYEDLPYAAFVEEHEIRRLAKRVISPTPTSYVVRLENFWTRKSRAVRTYASQLSPVVLKAFADHSSAVSNSEFPGEERLWISDPVAVAPAVDIAAWVTVEAAHRSGDYTTLFNSAFTDPLFQSSVGRTILMGPLYTPNLRPRRGALEDIQAVASSLGCYILYPPQVSNGWGLRKRMQTLLHDVESRYGIGIFYLRDREQEHQVDRILFDLSAVLDQRALYEPTLQGFLRDLKRRMNVSVDIDVRQYAASLRDWCGSDLTSNNRQSSWASDQWDYDPAVQDEGTRDAVLGLLLALPVSDCLRGLTQPDETAVLVATNSLSLPAGFAAKMQSEVYAPTKGPAIKTLFYCGEVAPIRKLAIGAASPYVPSLDAVGGFDWEGPVRSLVNLSLEHAPIDEQQMPILRRYLLDFEPLRHFSGQTDLRMLQQAWRLDAVAAASANVRDELLFFNRTFALRGEIPLITPGITPVSCVGDHKEHSRRKLISYAKLLWGFDDLDVSNTIIATQTVQTAAASPGSLLRTLNVLRAMAAQLPSSSNKKVLFIVIARWDEARLTSAPELRAIDELLRALNHVKGSPNSNSLSPFYSATTTTMTTTTTTSFSSPSHPNLRVRVINQPLWPALPERGLRQPNLSADDLARATDFSFCLDAYSGFAMSALEPMSCGAIAVLSTGCGAHRRVLELEQDETTCMTPAATAEEHDLLQTPAVEVAAWKEHVVIVDYAKAWTDSVGGAGSGGSASSSEEEEGVTGVAEAPKIIRSNVARESDVQSVIAEDVFDITLEERALLERSTNEQLAPHLLAMVPWTPAQRAAKAAAGRRLALQMSWEEQFSQPLLSVLKGLYAAT